ncbi:UpxY family transcription antiterminator [Formosa sp. 4Alg 33]|uniref:UpxY family transcription antiterminator n=1 Tax=Formosa sp. 4Alg 33 TaxID=3382189 RepID=UPI003D9C07B3
MKSRWYVVYTKSRNEKKVEANLNRLGIEAYCPVKTEIRVWSDRKKKVFVPLLPSMVLVKLLESERNEVFNVPGVVRYMFWNGEPVVVREDEVAVLKEVEQSKDMTLESVDVLKPGARVEMSDFGFGEEYGEVKHVSGNQCWVVLKKLGFVVKLQLQ